MEEFERIYVQYFGVVFRYAMGLCRDADAAEELTQETFFRAMGKLDSFRGECKLSVWLCQIARNTWYKSARRRARTVGPPPETTPAPGSMEQDVMDRDDAARLHAVLHALDEPYKEVFWMRTFGELSFREIGNLFGRTESWARVTYHRARIKIKEECT